MVGVKTEGRGAIHAQIRFNRNEGSGGKHGHRARKDHGAPTHCAAGLEEKEPGDPGDGIAGPTSKEDEMLRR